MLKMHLIQLLNSLAWLVPFLEQSMLLHKKAVPYAINSCALTGQKPCINKEFFVLFFSQKQLSI